MSAHDLIDARCASFAIIPLICLNTRTLPKVHTGFDSLRPLHIIPTSCEIDTMRLRDKIAIVIGAGQSPGEGMGNSRATCLRFAQEGAKVFAVDNRLASAEETAAFAKKEGGECIAHEADVTKEKTLAAAMAEAKRRWAASMSCITTSA
jgi:hypothetical protein